MNPSFLSRVGLLRWLAALVAVTYHVRFLLFAEWTQVQHKGLLVALFYFVTSLGHEALVVYMVLSGLLLGGLSWRRWEARVTGAWVDLWRKLGGLYMLLVPVLVAGGMLDLAGSSELDGMGVYANHPKFGDTHLSLVTLAGNLLLLQNLLVPGFGSNGLLYLLTYEWWAYLFLVVFWESWRCDYWRGLAAVGPIAIGLAVLAPGFASFFAAWLAGFAVARGGDRLKGKVAPWLGVAVFLGTLLASRISGSHLPGLAHGIVVLSRIALDLLVALGLAVMLLSLYGRQPSRTGAFAARGDRMQRWLIRLSVPVYAMQLPVIVFTVAAASLQLGLPLHTQPSSAGLVFFAAVAGVVYLCAYLVSLLVGALQAMLARHAAVLAAQYRVY